MQRGVKQKVNISFTLDLAVLAAAAVAIIIGSICGTVAAARWDRLDLSWTQASSLQRTEEFIKIARGRLRSHLLFYITLLLAEIVTVIAGAFLAHGGDLGVPASMLAIYVVANAGANAASESARGKNSMLPISWALVLLGLPFAIFILLDASFNARGVAQSALTTLATLDVFGQ